MTEVTHRQPTVVRRPDRGLSIAGTRITLYAIMDYVVEGWPASAIRDQFNLTDQQIADVIAYIEEHRDEVQAEYEQVLREADEIRAYWEERNRERFAEIAASPEHAAVRAKMAAHKAKFRRS